MKGASRAGGPLHYLKNPEQIVFVQNTMIRFRERALPPVRSVADGFRKSGMMGILRALWAFSNAISKEDETDALFREKRCHLVATPPYFVLSQKRSCAVF
jgi:hypothetical protein